MTKQKKPKKLSTEDFNAIFELIRDGSKTPQVKYTGQTFRGTRE